MKKKLFYIAIIFCISCNNTSLSPYKAYYPDGKLQIKTDYGKDTSNYYKTVYWENGNKQWEANYIGNKLTGIYKEYYENGTLKFRAEFTNGLQQGISEKYYQNGKLQSRNWYINGKKIGISKEYYQSGKLKNETGYINGLQQGLYKEYYEDGNLHIQAEYINDIAQGMYKEYYEDGKIAKDGFSAYDNIVYYKQYDEQGKLISEYHAIKIIPMQKDTIYLGDSFKAKLILYGDLGNKKLQMIIGQVSNEQHTIDIKDFKANNLLKNQQADYNFTPLKEGKYILDAGAIIPGAADSVITDKLEFVVLPTMSSKK